MTEVTDEEGLELAREYWRRALDTEDMTLRRALAGCAQKFALRLDERRVRVEAGEDVVHAPSPRPPILKKIYA
jgi:hypothetical protein